MTTFREKAAELIHKEWEIWAKNLILTEPNLTEKRINRWKEECFKDYNLLSEPMKNLDRMFSDKFIELSDNIINDRYFSQLECIKRLVDDYKKHGNLLIAFDFDNTVFDYFNTGERFPKMEKLLRFLKSKGFHLILFTGNEGEKLETIVEYCKSHGYEPNYINESPVMKTRKPYYNILLDDRAGLRESYETLVITLNILNYEF